MPAPNADPPLFVDLDGTLIATDVTWESILAAVKANPSNLVRIPVWFLRGRPYLKGRLAPWADLDPTLLPYNEPVVQFLLNERSRGRAVILASASHVRPVRRVAEHVALFDQVLATEGEPNLKGKAKLRAIREVVGPNGAFDYAGDSPADLPIWQAAREALLVNPSARTLRAARAEGNVAHVFAEGRRGLPAVGQTVRAYRWLKNLLILLPLLLSERLLDPVALGPAVLAFLSFTLVASGLVVVNDLMDIEQDRAHPDKRHRPLASGRLPVGHGMALAPLLLVAGALIAALGLPLPFLGVIALYFLISIGYSWALKKLVLVDALVLTVFYLLRIAAGSGATGLPVDPWIWTFAFFFFLSLSLAQRVIDTSHRTRAYRSPGKLGTTQKLDRPVLEGLGIATGVLAVGLSAFAWAGADGSAQTGLWFLSLIPPLLLFWIARIWILTHRDQLRGDLIRFASRDFATYAVALLILAAYLSSRPA